MTTPSNPLVEKFNQAIIYSKNQNEATEYKYMYACCTELLQEGLSSLKANNPLNDYRNRLGQFAIHNVEDIDFNFSDTLSKLGADYQKHFNISN